MLCFTAYIWLLHMSRPQSSTTLREYVVGREVMVGILGGGRELGPRTVLGTLCVLVSVGAELRRRRGGGEEADGNSKAVKVRWNKEMIRCGGVMRSNERLVRSVLRELFQ